MVGVGIVIGACAAFPSGNAEALTKRFHPAICLTDPFVNDHIFSETAGLGDNSISGGGDYFCPFNETTGFQKEDITEARVYFEQITDLYEIRAKACKTEAYTATPLASFTCSSFTESDAQGFSSLVIADLSAWDTSALIGFPYVYVETGAAFNPPDEKNFIRGIRLVY